MTQIIKKHLTLSFAVIFLMSTYGCKTSEQIVSDGTYHCQGNNPFWKVDINNDEITFEITGQDKVIFPAVSGVESGDLKIYATFLNEGDQKLWLKIKIQEGTCQTSSAGKVFPYKITVEKGEESFYGCGE